MIKKRRLIITLLILLFATGFSYAKDTTPKVNSTEQLTGIVSAENNDAFLTIDPSGAPNNLATEKLTEAAEEIASSDKKEESKTEEITSLLEDSGMYSVSEADNGTIEATSLFAYCRLRVNTAYGSINTSDASSAAYFEDHYLLGYKDEETTKAAYDSLCEQVGKKNVIIDLPVKISSQGWGTEYMGMNTKSQALTDGEDVVVAVVDTGINRNHEIFQNTNILDGYDYANGDDDPSDDNDHGTAVAGIIAESTPASVSILPIKAMKANGEGSLLDVLYGVKYASENGADIINLSLGMYADDAQEMALLEKTINKYLDTALLICAAGNEACNMDEEGTYVFPAECKKAVCVSAITSSGKFCSFSNYGSAVDFTAPGKYLSLANIDGGYETASGTSFSAPYISAAAALLKSENKNLDADDIKENLENMSVDLGDEGSDVYFGFGCPTFVAENPSVKKNISDAVITGVENKNYTGQPVTQTPVVTYNNELLIENTDYQLSYKNNTDAGIATITITGIGDYSGSSERTFEIFRKQASVEVRLATEELTYNRSFQTPDVLVLRDGQATNEYEISGGGTNAGIYELAVTLTGNYQGSASVSYTILPKKINPSMTLSETVYTYDGSQKTPSVTIKDGSFRLSANDYDLTYQEGRRNAGVYTVAATLKGNYRGNAEASFEIIANSSDPVLLLDKSIYTYTGSKIKPNVRVMVGGSTLDPSDYDVSYPSSINAGTYTVKATLKGNYSGTVSSEFTIEPKEVSPEVTLTKNSYTYDGLQKTPTVKAKYNGQNLSSFKVTYPAGRVNAGVYKVSVALSGNYKGTGSATFVIYKANNSLSVTGKTVKVKKSKKTTVPQSKTIKISKGQGALSFYKLKGNSKISINRRTGAVTVKKGLKPGTYKLQIGVTASGDANHSANSRYTTIKIKVKK